MSIFFRRLFFILIIAIVMNTCLFGMAAATGPDIIGNRLILPSPIQSGETSEIQDFIKNQGSVPASSFLIEYFLTSSPEQTKDKILIGIWEVSGLKSGAGKSGNTSVTIPPETVPGEYYLIRWIDAASYISGEISSNNLQRSKNPIIITTRKTSGLHGIGTFSAGTAYAGDQFPVTVLIANDQNTETGPVTAHLFLSSTIVPDQSGIDLGIVSIPSVAAGEEREIRNSVYIPPDTLPGEYYLFTSLIPVDMITGEAPSSEYWFNEDPIQITNSPDHPVSGTEIPIPAGPTSTGADVVGLETILPDEAFIGGSFQITDKMQNIGGATANIVRVGYQLSRNIDGTDGEHLGWWTTMNLKAGQTISEKKLLGVSSAFSPGLYYLTKTITITGSSTENTKDNWWVSNRPIYIRYNPADPIPDLTHVQTIWPVGKPGESVQITDTITDIGRACATGVSVAYYISPYSQFDAATASYPGVWKIDSICSGEQKTEATTVTIPSYLSVGEYYLYSVINPCWFLSECGEGSPELDTSNNINAGIFNVAR
ncbi:MAG: hypothetical protein CVV33_00100 [Methanomicrobiales archaeon HGW-Methanomicrobiales-4]|nr:MAG: hypothetical protein CVV33_00100 [Methanomicrobiales archaeon HGW-Methanomicrobiales-4]